MDNENIVRLHWADKNIILVGTAHVSPESVRQVERIIGEERPDSVCVELCRARHDALRQADGWQEMDIIKLIRENRSAVLLLQWVIAAYQRRLAQRLQALPGEEMLVAMKKAEEVGAGLILADRDIRVTLLRTWRALGFWGKVKLLAELTFSALFSDNVTQEEIEKLKKQDMLDLAIGDLEKKLPTVKTTLVDERDMWLAHRISQAPGPRIVAVVGAGHLAGVARQIGQEQDWHKLEQIPPASPWSSRLSWAVPALILIVIAGGFFFAGQEVGARMIFWWAGITALAAALGGLIMLAHPLTILAAALAAPFTTVHPFFAAGWVAGITEATLRKPRVKDFLNLRDDLLSLRGFFRNKIVRIFMTVALVNVTTSVGTLVAIPVMMSFF